MKSIIYFFLQKRLHYIIKIKYSIKISKISIVIEYKSFIKFIFSLREKRWHRGIIILIKQTKKNQQA